MKFSCFRIGALIDQCEEFFIYERDAAVNKRESGTTTSSSSFQYKNKYKSENSNLLLDFSSTDVDPVASEHEWNTQFVVRLEMVPLTYIPARVADKALFIGKAVHILQKTENFIGEALIPADTIEEFSEVIRQLKSSPSFHLLSLEIFLDRVRACVAKALWAVVVQVARLPEHLLALKNFFLLSNGEFYQCFIDESRGIMSAPPTLNAERDINAGPFAISAMKMGIDDDAFFKRFSLRLDTPEFRFPHFNGPSGLRNLIMVGSVTNGTYNATMNFDSRTEISSNATRLDSTLAGNDRASSESAIIFGSSKNVSSGGAVNTSGALWYTYHKGIDRGFTTKFKFACGKESSGLAFVIQLDRATAIGAAVDELGYEGILNSIAVEFDCGNINEAPHVAVHSLGHEGNTRKQTSCLGSAQLPVTDLRDCASHSVKIDYDLINDKDRALKVFWLDPVPSFSSTSTRTFMTEPILVVPINIPKLIKLDATGKAFVGFTSSSKTLSPTESSLDHVDFTQLLGWSFKSTLPGNAGGTASSMYDGWSAIGLNYKVSWPLHLIVTNYALDQYSNLFQYLFTVKRVASSLQIAWATITQGKYKKIELSKSYLLNPVWSLRSRMAFFVDNLQFYLNVDVIETQYQELQKKVGESQDFETVKTSHEQYLHAIASQSFLHSTVIRRALDDVFRVCLQFCFLVSKHSDDLLLIPSEELTTLSKDFDRYLCFLFSLIARLNTQLVLKLDFNGYLSAQSMSIGNSK
jgi:hypothetical protein